MKALVLLLIFSSHYIICKSAPAYQITNETTKKADDSQSPHVPIKACFLQRTIPTTQKSTRKTTSIHVSSAQKVNRTQKCSNNKQERKSAQSKQSFDKLQGLISYFIMITKENEMKNC